MARLNFLSAIAGAVFATLLGALPTAAAETAGTAKYVISLSGANIASVSVDLADTGNRYSLALDANVSGLGALVASGTARIASSGLSLRNALASEKFDLLTRADGEDFSVAIEFAKSNVTAFVVDPPLLNNIDRVAIERAHLKGVNDMIAAFILKGSALDKSLCQREMQIFTGLERFNIAMSYAGDDEATSKRTGYQGPVVLCNISYTPVSGHFTTSEITTYLAEDGNILIWYAPMGETGYFIPYRVLLTTSMGDLSMVLTGLSTGDERTAAQ